MNKRVYLGMSGGVDSSVSALLLKEQGYDVVGVYMKNWSEDLPGMKCPWAEDLADAKRVAVQLNLDFEVWDFETEYKSKVVDYMLAEFQKGRTPNPDVMCNELIKFKLFYEWALDRGADYIATGHYARVGAVEVGDKAEHDRSTEHEDLTRAVQSVSEDCAASSSAPDLLKAVDANKDQTYFLYRMSDAATAKTLFPIGALKKPEVKQIAKDHGLDVAAKKESMGICFVGEVGMKDFLQQYLDAQPGEIREQETGTVLGYHDGAIFYTIGQRHGLYLGGGLPYYVVGKDLEKNLVFVSKNLNHSALWTTELKLDQLHLRSGRTLEDLTAFNQNPASAHSTNPDFAKASAPKANLTLPLQVRLRHRAPLIDVAIEGAQNTCALHFSQPVKRPAPGQSAVLYSGNICLGGGIIVE